MKKSILFVVSLVLVLVGIVFSLWYFGRGQNTRLQKINLQLKWLHQTQFAGFYAADQLGFYKKEGLDVKLKPGGIDVDEIAQVNNGQAEFGIIGAEQLIATRANDDTPIKAIAAIYQRNPVVFMSKFDSGIQTPYDFVGKTVEVAAGPNTQVVYDALLENLDIDKSSIKTIPKTKDLQLLYDNKVDVIVGYAINEALTAEREGEALNLIFPDEYGIVLYGDVLVARDDLLANDPTLVKKFLKATAKGWEYAILHPEEVAQMVKKYDPATDLTHQKNMMRASLPLLSDENNQVLTMSGQIWQSMYDNFVTHNLIEDRYQISDFYTTEFLP